MEGDDEIIRLTPEQIAELEKVLLAFIRNIKLTGQLPFEGFTPPFQHTSHTNG